MGTERITIKTPEGTIIEVGSDPAGNPKVQRASDLPQPSAKVSHTAAEASEAKKIPQLRFVAEIRDGINVSGLQRKPFDINYQNLFTNNSDDVLETVADSILALLVNNRKNDDSEDSESYIQALELLEDSIRSYLRTEDKAKHEEEMNQSTLFESLPIFYEKQFLQNLYSIANDKFASPNLKNSSLNLQAYLRRIADYEPPDRKNLPF